MKQCFYVILVLSVFFLQGCREDDDLIVGKGEFYYNEQVYQLNNATKSTSVGTPQFVDGIMFIGAYRHELLLKSTDSEIIVTVLIMSGNIELLPCDCSVSSIAIKTSDSSIQYTINLVSVDDDNRVFFPTDMNLTYTKKGDIFEIKLKYIDSDNFLIKWEGPLKEINQQM